MDPVTIAILAAMAGGVATSGANKLFSGSESNGHKQTPRLGKKQIPLYDQLINANMNPGAGGSFGTSADYFRDLLSNDSQTMDQLSAPEMRRFNEEIIPDLSEQFAGMGSGGLSSSGFRNAAVNAGTDLSERLGAIRAGLRTQGAQGLSHLGQLGLGDYTNNTFQQNAPGFTEFAGQAIGNVGTQFASDYLKNKYASPNTTPSKPFLATRPTNMQLPQFNLKGSTSPYGGFTR